MWIATDLADAVHHIIIYADVSMQSLVSQWASINLINVLSGKVGP